MHNVLVVHNKSVSGALSKLFANNSDIEPHHVVGCEAATEVLSAVEIELIVSKVLVSENTNSPDSLQMMLRAKSLRPDASVLMLHPKSFAPVPELGVTSFIEERASKKKLEDVCHKLLEKDPERTLEQMELFDVVRFAFLSKRNAVLHIRDETIACYKTIVGL